MSNFTMIFQFLVRTIQTILKDIINEKDKVQYNFFLDMTFGIMKSSSLILNDIAHSLNEETILKKVNFRLQRNLEKELDIRIYHNYIFKCLSYMNSENLVFIVDDSDIIKPYGKKFESLSKVKDGSSLKNSYEKGYLVTSIVGISKSYKHPIPLYNKVHSSTEKNYKSVNNITNQGLMLIFGHLKSWSSIFIFDRGYDDQKLMNFINDNKQYFLIRIKKNRAIYIKKRKREVFSLAKRRKGKINIEINYKGKKEIIKVSHIIANVNNFKNKVTVIFSYLPGSVEPMVLITNKIISSKEELIKTVLNYVSRWKIEESFRFKKYQLGLENFRVKSLVSINNLCFILDIVLLILAHIVETQKKNMIYNEVIKLSKKLKDNITITYYQLMSGIKTLFTSNKMGVKNYKKIERWEYEENTLFNSLELSDRKRVRKKVV